MLQSIIRQRHPDKEGVDGGRRGWDRGLLVSCFVLLIPTTGFLVWELSGVLLYQARAPILGDATIYQAIGRGIVNGLVPYRDLFETKPPGILLLHAASIAVHDDEIFVNACYVIALVGSAALFPITAWRMTEDCRGRWRLVLVLLSSVLGMTIALFIADKTPDKKAEAYGVCFAFLFLSVVGSDQPPRMRNVLLASVSLLLSISMKEPFLLSIAAGTVLVSRTWGAWWRGFLLPSAIAGATGFGLLLALHYLGPYLTVYLPEMLGIHTQNHGSPLVRGLWIEVVTRKIISSSPLLPVLFVALLIVACYLYHEWRRPILGIVGILLAAVGASFLVFVVRVFSTIAGLFPVLPMHIYVVGLGIVAAGLAAMLVAAEQSERFSMLWTGVALIASLYLATTGITAGSELYDHHVLVGLPLFFVAFLLFLRSVAFRETSRVAKGGVLLICVLAGLASYARIPAGHFAIPVNTLRQSDVASKRTAAQLDALLDQCGYARYLSWESQDETWRQTRHSPLGPGFMGYQHPFNLNPSRPLFHDTFVKNQETADIAVLTETGVAMSLYQFGYRPDPPACATAFLPVEGKIILFRSQ